MKVLDNSMWRGPATPPEDGAAMLLLPRRGPKPAWRPTLVHGARTGAAFPDRDRRS